MLGTGGATKVVNDMSSLADIARAIGDSSKAEKLESIRDEFRQSLIELQNQEKVVQEKAKEVKDTADANSLMWNGLTKWENELKIKAKEIELQLEFITNSKTLLQKEREGLKSDKETLEKEKTEFFKTRDQMILTIKDVEARRDEVQAKRSSELDKREKAVKAREDSASAKEINIFKQSQLAEAFIKSMK